jgi:hypothetical protein
MSDATMLAGATEDMDENAPGLLQCAATELRSLRNAIGATTTEKMMETQRP